MQSMQLLMKDVLKLSCRVSKINIKHEEMYFQFLAQSSSLQAKV